MLFPRENPGSYVNPFDETYLAQCFECINEACDEVDDTFEDYMQQLPRR